MNHSITNHRRITRTGRSIVLIVCSLLTIMGLQGCLKETIEVTRCNTTSFLHTDPISAEGQALISTLNLLRVVNSPSDGLEYDSTKTRSDGPPEQVRKAYNTTTATVHGRKVYTLAPKTGASGEYILYIHGGAYVSNFLAVHFTGIMSNVIDNTGAPIIAPDYGLAPYYTYVQGYALIQSIYDTLVSQVGAEHITLMGDSAGAGLALGFAQTLKEQGKPQPRQIILLSPWLDITLSNPDIGKIQDPLLVASFLRQDGRAWAGTTVPNDFRVSPLNGSFEGLANISIFIGGRDMFLADVVKLRDMMKQRCLPLTVYEYPQMFHVWVAIASLPESQKAITEIARLIHR